MQGCKHQEVNKTDTQLTNREFADWTAKEIQKAMQENDIPAVAVGIIKDERLFTKTVLVRFLEIHPRRSLQKLFSKLLQFPKLLPELLLSIKKA